MCLLNSHEEKRNKPRNWIPVGWLPVYDESRDKRPGRGYESTSARKIRLYHQCWHITLHYVNYMYYLMLLDRYDVISCTHWLAAGASMGGSMPLIIGRSSLVMPGNWATIPCSLCCRTNSQGFCLSFMHFDLRASTFRPYPQTKATLMCMVLPDADHLPLCLWVLKLICVHGALEDEQVPKSARLKKPVDLLFFMASIISIIPIILIIVYSS